MVGSKSQSTVLKLRNIRREKGLSLNALAQKADLDYQKIGRVERGETQVTVDILQRLASVLEVPITKLLTEDDIHDLKQSISEKESQTDVSLVPEIYERLERFCQEHDINAENSVKVQLVTSIFKSIEDIRTNVKCDQSLVEALFQAFDAIFERIDLKDND